MAGPDPAIHLASRRLLRSRWMPGSSPGMTSFACVSKSPSRGTIVPGSCVTFPSKKQRAQGMPGARAHPQPRMRIKKAHELQSPQVRRKRSGIPCANGFNGYSTLSPAIGLSCHRRRPQCASIVAHLISASRYQDHVASPSALRAFVLRAKASTASHAQRLVTIGQTPL